MKVISVVLGIAAAVILSALIALGIKAFYSEPVPPSYLNYPIAPAPCATNDTKCQALQADYMQQQQVYEAHQQELQQAYNDQMKIYNKNLFIVANIIGIIVFAVGFWLVFGAMLSSHGVPIGIMLAGLWSIMYGYMRGWDSVNDQLKFFIGLVIALLVLGGSMWLIERYQKRSHKHTA